MGTRPCHYISPSSLLISHPHSTRNETTTTATTECEASGTTVSEVYDTSDPGSTPPILVDATPNPQPSCSTQSGHPMRSRQPRRREPIVVTENHQAAGTASLDVINRPITRTIPMMSLYIADHPACEHIHKAGLYSLPVHKLYDRILLGQAGPPCAPE